MHQRTKQMIDRWTGKRQGLLNVIRFDHKDKISGENYFLCHCDCGNEKLISLTSLKSGTKSCGCLIGKNRKKLYRPTISSKQIFTKYEEWFELGNLHFKGILKNNYSHLSDDTIVEIVDGGRINKGFKVKRNGNQLECEVYNYNVFELREMIKEDKKKGIFR